MENVKKTPFSVAKASFVALFAGLLMVVGAAFMQAPEKAYADDTYIAKIEVEGYGTITASLDRSAAPITVDNFVKLARSGFYNGLTIHRVVQDFAIQGGSPNGDGTGGSGTNIKGEFSANGVYNPIKHVRGTISMARGDSSYNTGSSQFFIVPKTSAQNTSALDGKYAAFGHVIGGMDVVDKLNNVATTSEKPNTTIKIKSITITQSGTSAPSRWLKSGSRYWYKYNSIDTKALGKDYPRSEEVTIDGKDYRFDSKGGMLTGWQKIGGKWYYMNTDGVMQTGKLDFTYLSYSNGSLEKLGDYYFLTSSGAMKTGWNKENGKWYYYKASGAAARSDFVAIGGKVYFFDGDGVMQTGVHEVTANGVASKFFFASSGAMTGGWQKIDGKWYYFGTDRYGLHPMLKNCWISGTYWVGSDGAMVTSHWVDNDRYYVGKDGKWIRNASK